MAIAEQHFSGLESKGAPAAAEASMEEVGPRVEFYSKSKDYGWMSNFSAHPVTDHKGQLFGTVEAFYQYRRFAGLKHAAAQQACADIMGTPPTVKGALEAKMIASRTKKLVTSPNWATAKIGVAWTGLCLKFAQHPHLQRQLLATGRSPLIHTSKSDRFWGVVIAEGQPDEGRNELGKMMEKMRMLLEKIDTIGGEFTLSEIRDHVHRGGGVCPHDVSPTDCLACGPAWRERSEER